MITLINLQRHIESGGYFGSDSSQIQPEPNPNQSNMEKQIETVYVPTDEAPYFIVKDVEKEFIKARVTEQEAYLYTPEEHAAAQQALSKAEDEGEGRKVLNQFYDKTTCQVVNGYHIEESGAVHNESNTLCIGCIGADLIPIKDLVEAYYKQPQPTNSLDELERWIKAESKFVNYPLNINARRTVDLILAKIKELKTITT